MGQFIRCCILGLLFTVLAACGGGGGGGEDGGNEAPSITSGAAPSVAENTTAVTMVTASDADGDSPTFFITGGADWTLFAINNLTGALAFNTAPDFESPADVGANNVYNLQVGADDGNGGTAIQNIAVTVVNLNEGAPVITSNAAPSVAENTIAVSTVTATDVDINDVVTFSVTGVTADDSLFSINTNSGVLTFNNAPNFEAPGDIGGNNVYDIEVTADDGNGGLTVQNITVTVTNVVGIDAPPGIYQGTITPPGGSAETAVGLITSNGKLTLVGRVTYEAIIGSISEGSISGTVFSTSVKGVTGTITSASGINITGTYLSSLGTGSFDLDADQALYSRGTSFAKLTGTWVDSVFTAVTGTTTWTFQNDGSYAMTSTTSCNGTGGFYLIDATKNEYEMDLTITTCGPIDGTYTGIGMMSDTSFSNDTLTFMFIDGTGTVGGLYEPIKQ